MLILIPPSDGKTKVKSTGIRFEKTNFQFEDEFFYLDRIFDNVLPRHDFQAELDD